jgi:hypothetical protein
MATKWHVLDNCCYSLEYWIPAPFRALQIQNRDNITRVNGSTSKFIKIALFLAISFFFKDIVWEKAGPTKAEQRPDIQIEFEIDNSSAQKINTDSFDQFIFCPIPLSDELNLDHTKYSPPPVFVLPVLIAKTDRLVFSGSSPPAYS